MKASLIAAALALGTTAFATVPSQAASVTITTRDYDRDPPRRHYGWERGNHYGWYKKPRDCELRRQVIWRDGQRIVRTVRECYR